MTKNQFIKLTGESPEDVFGPDWKNYMEAFEADSEYMHEGHERGGCFNCKMD